MNWLAYYNCLYSGGHLPVRYGVASSTAPAEALWGPVHCQRCGIGLPEQQPAETV